MTYFEDDAPFDCPYCGIENVMRVDLTAGEKQKFVVDCENCCHPILVRLEVSDTGIESLSVEKE